MQFQNYKIWTNDGLIEYENAAQMRHVDPRAAVKEFVETYDRNHSADMYFANYYSKARPKPLVIFLQDEKGNITGWSLTVETMPHYYVEKVE